MAAAHEATYQSGNLAEIGLDEFMRRLTDRVVGTFAASSSNVTVVIQLPEDLLLPLEKAAPLGLALNEIVTNSLKYAFPKGEGGSISIVGSLVDGRIQLLARDNGVGLPDDFNPNQTDTLGMSLVRMLIESQLGGVVEIRSLNGVEYMIRIPI